MASMAEIDLAAPTRELALEKAKKLYNKTLIYDSDGSKRDLPLPAHADVFFDVKDRGDIVHPNRRFIGSFGQRTNQIA